MQGPRLSPSEIPRHVAIIMDGNGRWAQDRGLSRVEGHREGLESVRAVVRAAHELGVQVLTLYAFSLENWNRPKFEVDELMRLLEHYMEKELDEVDRNGIRVRSIGRRDLLPASVRAKIAEAERRTRDNREMQLIFAVSYSGRAEIVDAARRLLRDAEQGNVDPEQLREGLRCLSLRAGDSRSRPPDPNGRGGAGVELPAVADRVHRALYQQRSLAGLPQEAPGGGVPRLPESRATLRPHQRPGPELI